MIVAIKHNKGIRHQEIAVNKLISIVLKNGQYSVIIRAIHNFVRKKKLWLTRIITYKLPYTNHENSI